MKNKDIKKGDIITYRNGRVNYVNKPYKYHEWYTKDFQHKKFGCSFDIMKIQRHIRCLCFYRLKTLYERGK